MVLLLLHPVLELKMRMSRYITASASILKIAGQLGPNRPQTWYMRAAIETGDAGKG
jgi:hypothetical protein